jgi:hypothetical protein
VFTTNNLRASVEAYCKRCDYCQRCKDPGPGVAEIPQKQELAEPFEEVGVDLVGPWNLRIPGHGNFEFSALTISCSATSLTEIGRIDSKSTQHVTMQFENLWLARYPKPARVVYDHGGEFTGGNFQAMLLAHNIKAVPTTAKNPRANAVAERVHHTMGDMLRAQMEDVREIPELDVKAMADSILASVSYGLRATTHRTLGVSPGAFVFGRDMMLNIPILADWNLIRERKQAQMDLNNAAENKRRRFKDYTVGDEVLILKDNPSKLEDRAFGPFVIHQIFANGTLLIERHPGVMERINVRRVKPYVR